MGVDVFGHTLSFMPDNFLDESYNSGTEKVRRRVYKSDGHISGSFSIQRTVQSFQQWELL